MEEKQIQRANQMQRPSAPTELQKMEGMRRDLILEWISSANNFSELEYHIQENLLAYTRTNDPIDPAHFGIALKCASSSNQIGTPIDPDTLLELTNCYLRSWKHINQEQFILAFSLNVGSAYPTKAKHFNRWSADFMTEVLQNYWNYHREVLRPIDIEINNLILAKKEKIDDRIKNLEACRESLKEDIILLQDVKQEDIEKTIVNMRSKLMPGRAVSYGTLTTEGIMGLSDKQRDEFREKAASLVQEELRKQKDAIQMKQDNAILSDINKGKTNDVYTGRVNRVAKELAYCWFLTELDSKNIPIDPLFENKI